MTIEGHIYIADLVDKLGRAEHTIRQWIRREDFPASCRPQTEGGRGKFFWVEAQMPALEAYALERASHRGWPSARSTA